MVNPHIKAGMEYNADAIAIAIANKPDDEHKHGDVRSRMHHISFLVKDNVVSKDNMQTTAWAAALMGATVPDDARVLGLLRAAGGVLLGRGTYWSGRPCEPSLFLSRWLEAKSIQPRVSSRRLQLWKSKLTHCQHVRIQY